MNYETAQKMLYELGFLFTRAALLDDLKFERLYSEATEKLDDIFKVLAKDTDYQEFTANTDYIAALEAEGIDNTDASSEAMKSLYENK